MPTEHGAEATFMMIVGLMLVDHIFRMGERYDECQAIEQATYDREFWELVGADA